MYRAMESERPDALFWDPYARMLAGPEGEAMVRAMPKGRQSAWAMIVRTAVMDELIMNAVNRDGADTVLNLAAGLDTRPYRLSLPGTVRWVDADLADVLAYKETRLAGKEPVCALEYANIDLTDSAARLALFERVDARANRTIVITEGLLVYLEPSQVEDLARDLHAHLTFNWWLIDLASPRVLKMLERTWGKHLRAGGAPMRFGPKEGTVFFAPFGWTEREFRSMWEESLRLNRSMRFARLRHWVGRLYPKKKREEFRRMSGIVLLERE